MTRRIDGRFEVPAEAGAVGRPLGIRERKFAHDGHRHERRGENSNHLDIIENDSMQIVVERARTPRGERA